MNLYKKYLEEVLKYFSNVLKYYLQVLSSKCT